MLSERIWSQLYNFIYMKFPEKAKLERQRSDQWVPPARDRNKDWLQIGKRKLSEVMEGF